MANLISSIGQRLGIAAFAMVMPAVMTADHFGSQYLQDHYGPRQSQAYHLGQELTLNGDRVRFIGFSGHEEKTAQRLDTTSGREVWVTPSLSVAQKYADVNAGTHGKPGVAVLVQRVGASSIPEGFSRYDNGLTPLLPESEHGVHVLTVMPVTSETDVRTKTCFQRFIKEKQTGILERLEAVKSSIPSASIATSAEEALEANSSKKT
jgi:hypothetical protein